MCVCVWRWCKSIDALTRWYCFFACMLHSTMLSCTHATCICLIENTRSFFFLILLFSDKISGLRASVQFPGINYLLEILYKRPFYSAARPIETISQSIPCIRTEWKKNKISIQWCISKRRIKPLQRIETKRICSNVYNERKDRICRSGRSHSL